MKRFVSLLVMIVVCLTLSAQGKLTPGAQLSIERYKAKTARKAAKALDPNTQEKKAENVTLVLKVAEDNVAETVKQIKAAGATIYSRLGKQVVVSIPVDSVEALQKIEGVLRIDKGHKGRKKTDVTRVETGVNMLNGPAAPLPATSVTGKGVNVCISDVGIDFQHPAFKDAEGRSRIKCVYLMDDEGGNKFTVNDPVIGEYTFPGSVYDTPELIAQLTTDDDEEYHGTHTASIAAGSISPLGFGGMAPEADLVLIPFRELSGEGYEEITEDDIAELAIAFAAAYGEKSQQPTVLSVSANSHAGPHDGTSTVTEAIEEASTKIIPVFSAGNEGGYPIHLHHVFTSSKPSINTILIGLLEDESGEYEYQYMADVAGYTRRVNGTDDEVKVKLTLKSINMLTGALNTLWTSEECSIKYGEEPKMQYVSSDTDANLAKYFDGEVMVSAYDNGDGRLAFRADVYGGIKKLYLFQLTISGAKGTEIDAWDNLAGFGGVEFIGLPGYVDGDSEMSAGDWTCTDRVISVGAYCANTILRDYDGTTTDTSVGQDEDVDKESDIAWFSSYGTSFNGVVQPTVCAPGVNVVSAFNHYYVSDGVAEGMQWQGYPYGAESGTSMSCPVVSGIIALWLQANPDMTFEDVKDVLSHSSTNDNFTADAPDRWGYGKINAVKGLEYLASLGIQTPGNDADSNVSDAVYDLQGRRIFGKPTHGMYIQNRKIIVIK